MSTIQDKIEKVLEKMTGEEIQLVGCGRTDSGVHADNYIANLKTNSTMSIDEMKKYLNIVENWSDKLKYLIIYSTEKSEKDMINGDVYYLLNQIKEKPFFKDMTAIVVCK